MPIASVNGIEISYIIHNPPSGTATRKAHVVLINGLADEKESWAYQIYDLTKAGYQVLAFDNRGIGKTSAPAGPYTAALLAADTKALITKLDIVHFHLVGVSMGGMIVQQFAVDYPDGIVSLVIACTYATPGPFCSRMFDMWSDTASVMGVPHVMRDVLLWCFTTGFFDDRPDEVKELEDSMRYMTMSVPAYLSQLAVIQRFEIIKDLHKLSNVPTLVLAGDQDILIPVSLSRKMHEAIPNSRWLTVKGGHGCMWEFPKDFNTGVVNFIGGVDSGDFPSHMPERI